MGKTSSSGIIIYASQHPPVQQQCQDSEKVKHEESEGWAVKMQRRHEVAGGSCEQCEFLRLTLPTEVLDSL